MLHALLSFHQETALTLPQRDPKSESEDNSAGAGVVVFPSNRELSIRAHGMAPATLRRHLASLVEAGLIIRRDSPNGKRFARRGQLSAISESNHIPDLEPRLRKGRGETSGPMPEEPQTGREGAAETEALSPGLGEREPSPRRNYPLGMVLQACPDIVDYGKRGEISGLARSDRCGGDLALGARRFARRLEAGARRSERT